MKFAILLEIDCEPEEADNVMESIEDALSDGIEVDGDICPVEVIGVKEAEEYD